MGDYNISKWIAGINMRHWDLTIFAQRVDALGVFRGNDDLIIGLDTLLPFASVPREKVWIQSCRKIKLFQGLDVSRLCSMVARN